MRTFDFRFKGHAGGVPHRPARWDWCVGKLTHIDCWRIGPQDLYDLGFSDLKKDPNRIICLEWADRVKAILPKTTIRIVFSHVSKTKRTVMFLSPFVPLPPCGTLKGFSRQGGIPHLRRRSRQSTKRGSRPELGLKGCPDRPTPPQSRIAGRRLDKIKGALFP